MRLFLLVLAVWVGMWETWWSPPASVSGTPAGSFMASLAGVSAMGLRGSPSADASAGFSLNSVAPPVCGTLVAFWRVQPVPLPASNKFNSSPKGSFPVNFISTQGAVFFPPPAPGWGLSACQPWSTRPGHGSWLVSQTSSGPGQPSRFLCHPVRYSHTLYSEG